jgi:hypothetical protein
MSYGAVATIVGTSVLAATFSGTTAVRAEQALDRTKERATTILPFAAKLSKIATPLADSAGPNWTCNAQLTHTASTNDNDCSWTADA